MTAATETKAPKERTFKPNQPTARDTVLMKSLSDKVKELTTLDVSPEVCRAVKFSLSRWYADPATSELMKNKELMEKQTKAASLRARAARLLAEADAAAAEAGIAPEAGEDDEDEGDPTIGHDEDEDGDVEF